MGRRPESFRDVITTLTLEAGGGPGSQFTVFYGQPIFLLWLLIHFIVSGRHYTGIATKKYWKELMDDQ